LLSSSAFAADLSPVPNYKAPPLPPPVSWTGCYVDGGVGYGLWKQDHYGELSTGTSFVPPFTPVTPSASTGGEGWLGRIGAGCDYQIGSRWLIGAFADYDFTGLSGSFQDPWTAWIGNENETGEWAVGGRIGVLVTPRLLTYFDGGYTQAHFGQINLLSDSVPQFVPFFCGAGPCYIPAHTYTGWFIGGGTEYALSDIVPLPGLFWRTEYRYAGYRSADLPILTASGAQLINDTPLQAVGEHLSNDVQTITSGLVWRFNWTGGY
jgi:outer membrane immunogenic protein